MNLHNISAQKGLLEIQDIPIDRGLPESVIEAVEDVEKHRSDVARVSPIDGLESIGINRQAGGLVDIVVDVETSVVLISISTPPDNHGNDIEHNKTGFGTNRATELLDVKSITKNQCTENLCCVVEKTVQSSSTHVESGSVDSVLLISVEPVGAPEHWEEKDDKWFISQCLPKAHDLGLPSGVLHQHNLGVVWTNNV